MEIYLISKELKEIRNRCELERRINDLEKEVGNMHKEIKELKTDS